MRKTIVYFNMILFILTSFMNQLQLQMTIRMAPITLTAER